MKKIKRTAGLIATKTSLGKFLLNFIINRRFAGSKKYWENRYAKNGNSGKGSYGKSADYKAKFLNDFVLKNDISSVIEFGCGDGNQLKELQFKNYIGLDISPTIVEHCKRIFANDTAKKFFVADDNVSENFQAQLSISLDVIYHLVENNVFESYMKQLFLSAQRFVIIYSWDVDGELKGHVRHRNFSKWVFENIQGFDLIQRVKSQDFCDFLVYKKIN